MHRFHDRLSSMWLTLIRSGLSRLPFCVLFVLLLPGCASIQHDTESKLAEFGPFHCSLCGDRFANTYAQYLKEKGVVYRGAHMQHGSPERLRDLQEALLAPAPTETQYLMRMDTIGGAWLMYEDLYLFYMRHVNVIAEALAKDRWHGGDVNSATRFALNTLEYLIEKEGDRLRFIDGLCNAMLEEEDDRVRHFLRHIFYIVVNEPIGMWKPGDRDYIIKYFDDLPGLGETEALLYSAGECAILVTNPMGVVVDCETMLEICVGDEDWTLWIALPPAFLNLVFDDFIGKTDSPALRIKSKSREGKAAGGDAK